LGKKSITVWDRLGKLSVPEQFKLIYKEKLWTANGNRDTICGAGSTLSWTVNLRNLLPKIFKKYKIKTFIDCGCGDCFWISKIDWSDIAYIGADVVPEMLRKNREKHPDFTFIEKNIIEDVPKGDMVFIRDVFNHLSINDVSRILKNIKTNGSKYLMASTYTNTKENVETLQGKFRKRNLVMSPFSLPDPLEYINDEGNKDTDRKMGVWKI